MNKPSEKTEFWICNISDRNVSLRDLGISVPARKGVNLLSNHYQFSYDQVKKSMISGSIFAKKNIIKVSKGPPQESEEPDRTICKYPMIARRKMSATKVEEPTFDEFNFSDEQFADDMTRDFDEDV